MIKAEEVVNKLYKAYGGDSGYLLGLEPKYRDTVQVIVGFTLDYNKSEDKIKLLEHENKALKESVDSLIATNKLLERQYKELEEIK